MGLLEKLPPPPNGKTGWPWTVETDEGERGSRTYPRITIITPSFNQGEFIEETIRSVLLQNYPDLEYIIIDGASTDPTPEMIRKYEPWISYWISEPDSGQSSAINKGLVRVSGEIVNWINSDDLYEPGALFSVARFFMDHPDLDICAGKETVFENDHPDRTIPKEGTTVCPSVVDTILTAHIDQPPTFWRTSAFLANGPVNEEYHYLMDSEFWVRYLLANGQKKVGKCGQFLTRFRLHGDSKTVKANPRFELERKILELSLAEICGTPGCVTEYMKEEAGIDRVIPILIRKENCSPLAKPGRVAAHFSYINYGHFYFNHEFDKCRIALRHYLARGHVIINLNLLKTLIGVFLLPQHLLKKILS
ncbi:MAG: glycosyltransferase family 2 protein [Bacteroidota bacterium]